MLSDKRFASILLIKCVRQCVHFCLCVAIIVLLTSVLLMLVYSNRLVCNHKVYLNRGIPEPIVIGADKELPFKKKWEFLG